MIRVQIVRAHSEESVVVIDAGNHNNEKITYFPESEFGVVRNSNEVRFVLAGGRHVTIYADIIEEDHP
jgi:hypothetical protein